MFDESPHHRPSAETAPRPPLLVESAGELRRWCERWRRAPALGVDTEFVRERTFFPALGLLQVSDGTENVLVDPLSVEDLGPLWEVLSDPGIDKVLHSCSEDLEVFFHRFGDVPRPIFDTQTASAFAGLGYSLGYRALVARVLDVDLPKDHTRSNWLRRPLSDGQKRYAALDVAHLLPLHRWLRDRLDSLGRTAWLSEDLERLADTGRFAADPEGLYRKLSRSGTLSRRQLAVLRALCGWREHEARRRDLPRNFVLHQTCLTRLAAALPRRHADLSRISQLRPEEIRRHGHALVRLVRQALELPESELPEKPGRPADLSPHRGEIAELRRVVAETAAELQVPAELLASKKTLEALVRRHLTGRQPSLPRALRGWRREVVGARLLAALRGGESRVTRDKP